MFNKNKIPDRVVRPLRLFVLLFVLYIFITDTIPYLAGLSSSDFEAENICISNQESNKPLIININTATSLELQELRGIGLTKARAIIAYREEYGYFKSVEELGNVNGISEKMIEELREFITVDITEESIQGQGQD